MKSRPQRKAKKAPKARTAKKSARGIFLTFEGGEGVGKTTQIAKLAHAFEAKGYRVVVTREPGGSKTANRIRSLLLDPEMKDLTSLAELLLYEASRAQHVAEVIKPALELGKVVICDRFADSSLVYQGAARGISSVLVAELNRVATGGLKPTHTFVLDLDPRIGLARVGARGILDRMEKEKLSFHKAVRRGYQNLVKREPRRCRYIDASQSRDRIHEQILEELKPWLS